MQIISKQTREGLQAWQAHRVHEDDGFVGRVLDVLEHAFEVEAARLLVPVAVLLDRVGAARENLRLLGKCRKREFMPDFARILLANLIVVAPGRHGQVDRHLGEVLRNEVGAQRQRTCCVPKMRNASKPDII